MVNLLASEGVSDLTWRLPGGAVQIRAMAAANTNSSSARDDAVSVVKRLRQAGHEAYFAGGCVRDLLLGGQAKDYDIATNAPPKRVREIFFNTQAVGAAFGVILVRVGSSVIEVATFRSDGQYLDGRHPSEIRFTTAEEDARRRDFTINGLFLDPLSGQVIDFVGGQEDLRAGRIRAIGDPIARFGEDSLRLLRAIRFSARLGFAIEPATFEAIRSHADQLRRISPERIAEELRQMLSPKSRDAAWRLLWKLRIIHEIFRFMPSVDPSAAGVGPFLFSAVLPAEPISFGLALAAGTFCYWLQTRPRLSDIRPLLDRPEVLLATHAMRQALKISNDETELLRETLLGAGLLLGDQPPTVSQKKRFLARPTENQSVSLLKAIAGRGIFSDRISPLLLELAELKKTEFAPLPFLTGDHLTALGLAPGPAYKKILDAVYDAQLESRLADESDAVRFATQIMQNLGT